MNVCPLSLFSFSFFLSSGGWVKISHVLGGGGGCVGINSGDRKSGTAANSDGTMAAYYRQQ